MLYVVGRVVDLEYSLRGLAIATEKATYGMAMVKRVAAAKENLKKISIAVPKPEVQEIVAIRRWRGAKARQRSGLMDAAEKISTAEKRLPALLKALIPPSSQYKGPVFSPRFLSQSGNSSPRWKNISHRPRLGSHLPISRRSDLLLAA